MKSQYSAQMARKVLIIPDKFKGTLTAAQAARAIAQGWRRGRSHDRLQLLPMSDGGDGFGEVLSSALGAKPQKVKTMDAAHRSCTANWWWEPKTKTAIIESARIIGLAMLPPGRFHPFQLDTFGLGAVVRAAVKKGAKEIIIGIGGSATNDGGFGLARSLGWEFRDRAGEPITRWTDLHRLAAISRPTGAQALACFNVDGVVDFGWEEVVGKLKRRERRAPLKRVNVIVAVDVQNPLLGPRGATRVYGPQKGIRPKDVAPAERCLRRLAQVCSGGLRPPQSRRRSQSAATVPGSGAAGGLGFGLLTFLNARPEPGFELIAGHVHLNRLLQGVDLVVTGEGAIDRSTLMGKGTGQVAKLCKKHKVPCIGLAGMTTHEPALKRLFVDVRALTDLTTSVAAKSRPAFWLERLAKRMALNI